MIWRCGGGNPRPRHFRLVQMLQICHQRPNSQFQGISILERGHICQLLIKSRMSCATTDVAKLYNAPFLGSTLAVDTWSEFLTADRLRGLTL